ncbi:peptidylprolyl isomerase [Sarracenia purpurea var. burkii]
MYYKHAPRTCRNFIELSRRGYYDNVKFHRIIKDFIVQGGDPTGTGRGGESIYGRRFWQSRRRLRYEENSGFKVGADEPGCAGDENRRRESRCDDECEAKSGGAHCVSCKENQRNRAAIFGFLIQWIGGFDPAPAELEDDGSAGLVADRRCGDRRNPGRSPSPPSPVTGATPT